jgi:hypothetical protein
MRWVWKEIFSMEIPESWNIKDLGDLIEIIPPEPVGAAHISILRRKKSDDVNDEEPTIILKNFAHKQGFRILDNDIRRIALNIRRASFKTEDKQGHLCWIVYVHVWRTRAVLCSYCYDCKEHSLCDQAEQMFDSIQPEKAALSWVQ